MAARGSLHLLGSHETGGAERFFVRLVEALERRGHPVAAVLRRDSPVDALLAPGIERIHLPFASKWDLYTRCRIARLVRQRRPAVAQSYMGRATRLTHVPPDAGTLHVARLGGFYRLRGYYEHAHAWVGNTRAVCAHLLAAGFAPERVACIGNFVPLPAPVHADAVAALRTQLALPPGAFVLLALGRLLPKKGFADLIDAFARLAPTLDERPLVLVIGGDGPEREALQQAAARPGLQGRVHWTGWVNDPAPCYALADLFVCPSRHEPLGNVILEAWAHERPVVSTRHEGAREIATDGVDALLAPMADPAGLAAALQRALDLGDAGRARLGQAGWITSQREHGEEQVVAAYLGLYERIAALRSRDR